MRIRKILPAVLCMAAILIGTGASCDKSGKIKHKSITVAPKGPDFSADSALAYCYAQCAFGPRVMNSPAHEQCAQWIKTQFERLGCTVEMQQATLTAYNGTALRSTNIIARYKPERPEHVLIAAHWDSRPWADNDPDSANWRTPVMAANDGASGVAVMIELARLLQQNDSLNVGVDFICFDAEDWGCPQWDNQHTGEGGWALGADYWASHYQPEGYTTRFGILLDMVGGEGAQFCQEGESRRLAGSIVDKVWSAAHAAGYSGYFPFKEGGNVTDDHIPVNQKAGIPMADVIPFYPHCRESSFGPTWHTVNDDMDHIDKNTLKAVGQTVVQVLYSEP